MARFARRSEPRNPERQVCIGLTEAGRKLRARASDIVRCVRNATNLQDRKMKELLTDLNALRQALEGDTSD